MHGGAVPSIRVTDSRKICTSRVHLMSMSYANGFSSTAVLCAFSRSGNWCPSSAGWRQANWRTRWRCAWLKSSTSSLGTWAWSCLAAFTSSLMSSLYFPCVYYCLILTLCCVRCSHYSFCSIRLRSDQRTPTEEPHAMNQNILVNFGMYGNFWMIWSSTALCQAKELSFVECSVRCFTQHFDMFCEHMDGDTLKYCAKAISLTHWVLRP